MARFSSRKNKSILCCEIERRRQGHDYFAKDLVSKLIGRHVAECPSHDRITLQAQVFREGLVEINYVRDQAR